MQRVILEVTAWLLPGHVILILTMSGSMFLLQQMANNPLTVEGATALVVSVRKNAKSMMEEINISVRAYVLENLQNHTLHVFRKRVDHRAAPFQNCFEICCLCHLSTATNKRGCYLIALVVAMWTL